MPIFKMPKWNAGQGLEYGDLDNIARFLRSQLWDGLGAAFARVSPYIIVPWHQYLWCFGSGGAPYWAAGGMAIKSVAGIIAQQVTPGSVNGSDVAWLAYYLDDNELGTTLNAADGTHPRIDMIAAKLDEVDDATVERHFQDEVSGARTAQSMSVTRSPRITKQYVVGTPAVSPVEPALPAGYVRWARIYVPAGASALANENIWDDRMPVGFTQIDIPARDAFCDDPPWVIGRPNFWWRHTSDANPQPMIFAPMVPGGDHARLVAAFLVSEHATASGSRKAEFVRFKLESDYSSVTVLRDVSANLVPAAGLAGPGKLGQWLGTSDPWLGLEPFWLNGRPSGYANASMNPGGPIGERFGLQYTSGGGGISDYAYFARFWVAG
jgi:hypothetical protein